jgi:site-specific recombinase XerD
MICRRMIDLHNRNLQGRVSEFMEKEISAFVTYLHNIKHTSNNTELSYKRDLAKVEHFMASRGITEVSAITGQDLADYVQYWRITILRRRLCPEISLL